MHAAIGAFALAAAEVTPSPSPTAPPPELVTPGPWGFAVIAFIALAVVVLIWDMMRRVRRGRVRADIREELDAEELATQQAAAATLESNVDDEAVDAADDADPPQR